MAERGSTPSGITRARAGDRDAFAELAERHRAELEARVDARLGERLRGWIEVEDVVQETFARALASIASFRWRGAGSFDRWLAGIAENVIRGAAGRAERRPGLLRIEPPVSPVSPSRVRRREERFERLEAVLRGLPRDYREVIRLARIDGLKHAEIATRMGRSHAAVRQLVLRALRMLRERFGDTESLGLPRRSLERDRSDHDA